MQTPDSVLQFEGTRLEGPQAIIEKVAVRHFYSPAHMFALIAMQSVGQLEHNIPQFTVDVQVLLMTADKIICC
jgi:hypothetical protein